MNRIGYIDENEGWRNQFHHFFKDEFEVVLFEITEETDGDSLVNEVFEKNIDILVIDFLLDETGLVDFNADTLVDKIQERNFYYPMIILTSHESDALDHLENVNLIYGKDILDGENEVKEKLLKKRINKIVNNYKNKMTESMIKLKQLEKKRIEEGLNPDEEDNYVELNIFLDKSIAARDRLPRTFYYENTNKKLDEIISKTEELLKKITEND